LTNFEANAKQNEVKINNRFSEELPADADETNVTRQKNAFLCYASNSIKSQSSTFFGGSCNLVFPSKTQNPMKHIFRKELLPHSRPYSMSYAGHQFGNWGQLETGELLSLQK
jgi:uncharacterized protein YdiU (UPF0061 family)